MLGFPVPHWLSGLEPRNELKHCLCPFLSNSTFLQLSFSSHYTHATEALLSLNFSCFYRFYKHQQSSTAMSVTDQWELIDTIGCTKKVNIKKAHIKCIIIYSGNYKFEQNTVSREPTKYYFRSHSSLCLISAIC